MSPVIVLVTFYSRCGSTETLASSAAVGAVQARANIRLRRVADASAEHALEAFPQCRETLVRMHKEYVVPTEADVLAADALVIVPPAGFDAAAPEWAGYLDVLDRLASEGRLRGKAAAVVDPGDQRTLSAFASRIERLGVTMLPTDGSAKSSVQAAAQAREQGRALTGLVHSLRPRG